MTKMKGTFVKLTLQGKSEGTILSYSVMVGGDTAGRIISLVASYPHHIIKRGRPKKDTK